MPLLSHSSYFTGKKPFLTKWCLDPEDTLLEVEGNCESLHLLTCSPVHLATCSPAHLGRCGPSAGPAGARWTWRGTPRCQGNIH